MLYQLSYQSKGLEGLTAALSVVCPFVLQHHALCLGSPTCGNHAASHRGVSYHYSAVRLKRKSELNACEGQAHIPQYSCGLALR